MFAGNPSELTIALVKRYLLFVSLFGLQFKIVMVVCFALLCFAWFACLLGMLACLLACLPACVRARMRARVCVRACLRACVRAFVCACMLACMRARTHACVSCVCVRVDLTCFALLGFAFVEFLRSSVLASLLLLRGCSFVSLVLSSMPSLSLPPSPPSPHPAPTPLLAIPGRSPWTPRQRWCRRLKRSRSPRWERAGRPQLPGTKWR